MSQMNTFQVNTVYTVKNCVYVVSTAIWRGTFDEQNEHTASYYSVYWEKVCVRKSQMQLFEEEHTHPDVHATTTLRYEQPSCWTKQGKISCLIAVEIRDNWA